MIPRMALTRISIPSACSPIVDGGSTMGLVTNITKRFSQGFSLSASYTYNYGKNNFARVEPGTSDFYWADETDAFNPDLDYARDDFPHVVTIHSLWELPILRGRTDWLGRILGGWQLNTIWLFQSGELFVPLSTRRLWRVAAISMPTVTETTGPTSQPRASHPALARMNGYRATQASQFPLPDPATPRPGTLPRDVSAFQDMPISTSHFIKEFGVWKENGKLQLRAEAFNAFNRVNLSSIVRSHSATPILAPRPVLFRIASSSLPLSSSSEER